MPKEACKSPRQVFFGQWTFESRGKGTIMHDKNKPKIARLKRSIK